MKSNGAVPEVLQSLTRGMRVLAFLNHVGSATTGSLARSLQLPRSTTHRILCVLAEMGLVRLDAASGLYFLGAGVLDLSKGFRDDEWIERCVEPRLRQWTRVYHWPLVLSTPLRGVLTVRVSTDNDRPIAAERITPGTVVPTQDSPAGALFRAYTSDDSMPGEQFNWSSHSRPGIYDPELIREMGFASSSSPSQATARVSVPLLSDGQFLGCLTMLCAPESIHEDADCSLWVRRLKSLAADLVKEFAAPLTQSSEEFCLAEPWVCRPSTHPRARSRVKNTNVPAINANHTSAAQPITPSYEPTSMANSASGFTRVASRRTAMNATPAACKPMQPAIAPVRSRTRANNMPSTARATNESANVKGCA
jgi:IclR family mhp operon transcriptional activator